MSLVRNLRTRSPEVRFTFLQQMSTHVVNVHIQLFMTIVHQLRRQLLGTCMHIVDHGIIVSRFLIMRPAHITLADLCRYSEQSTPSACWGAVSKAATCRDIPAKVYIDRRHSEEKRRPRQ